MQKTLTVDKRIFGNVYLNTLRLKYFFLKLGYGCLTAYSLFFLYIMVGVLFDSGSVTLTASRGYVFYPVVSFMLLGSIPFVLYAVVHIFNDTLSRLHRQQHPSGLVRQHNNGGAI